MKNYVIKLDDNELIYYYFANNKIFETRFSNYYWAKSTLITENVSKSFSLALSPKKAIHIFYQDTEGNVISMVYENDEWTKKTILVNNNDNEKIPLNFSGFFDNDDFLIFYTVPSEHSNKYKLMSQQLLEDKSWSAPNIVDDNLKYDVPSFKIHSFNNTQFLSYCNILNQSYAYGYKLFTFEKFDNFNSIVNTKQNILDISITTLDDTLYSVYLVKGLFSYQLLYREINEGDYSPVKTLYEGQRVNNILTFISNDKLYVSYTVNEDIFYMYSNDLGITFSKIQRYKKSFSNITKTNYISAQKTETNNFISSEIYCTNKNKVVFIDDICENFYTSVDTTITKPTKEKDLDSEIEKYKKIIDENNSKYEDYIAKVQEHINLLESKNNVLLDEIQELKIQINK